MLRGIKVAMIISFLKQVLKLFWDNCKLVVLSQLLEKFYTLFANIAWGKQNPFYSTATGRLGFQVSGFLNTGIERQHQYLSYKLLNTSVTLFLHIELRDSHSIPITPVNRSKVSFTESLVVFTDQWCRLQIRWLQLLVLDVIY